MAEEGDVAVEAAPDAPPRAEAVSELKERFERGLDKVAPLPKSQSESATPVEQPPPVPPLTPQPEPKPKEAPPKPPPPAPREDSSLLLPSFLQKKEGEPAAGPGEEVEIPDELPGVKGEKGKAGWTQFRDQYRQRGSKIKELSTRLSELESQTGKPDAATQERLQQLEQENQKLLGITERVSIQNHPRFVAEILEPRNSALEYAKTIVKDAGGNPRDLESALAVSGQAHYSALEEIYSGLPEVAKGELSAVIKDIRLFDRRRDQILSDPRRNLEQLRKEDLITQQRQLQEQERETDGLLERTLVRMREHNKVEVLQRSTDPKDKWWNDQVDQIENTARQLAKTHDPEQLMAAIALAPMTDIYRKLFLDSQKEIERLKSRHAAYESHEPNLDGEGEITPTLEKQKKEIAKPIGQAFRDILQRNRRT